MVTKEIERKRVYIFGWFAKCYTIYDTSFLMVRSEPSEVLYKVLAFIQSNLTSETFTYKGQQFTAPTTITCGYKKNAFLLKFTA